ncbi:DNA/RNA nuclease SfsA [Halanaerobaculum tunisiense]
MAEIKFGYLQAGRLIERSNRFVAKVNLEGEKVKAYVPNPGRLEELMLPEAKVFVKYKAKPGRTTDYDLLLIEHQGELVSLDTRLPNKLVAKGLEEDYFPQFRAYSEIIAEYTIGDSRLDFLLRNKEEECLIEVKSVTLVEDNVAKFPDAPTKRGRRHLEELIAASDKGYRSIVLFVIQRENIDYFTPCRRIDLELADKLEAAREAGVEIYAYACETNRDRIKLDKEIEVRI